MISCRFTTTLIKANLLLLFCVFFLIRAGAQHQNPRTDNNQWLSYFPPGLLNSDTNARPVYRKKILQNVPANTSSQRLTSESCNTPTFYMRMPALAGEKIELKEMQTEITGNFIAVGNSILSSGQKEGLIIRMSNGGSILSQKKVSVNSQPAILFDAKTIVSGKTVIAGVLGDGSNSVFVSLLKDDLSTEWMQIFQMTSVPVKMTVELFDTVHIAMAVQLSEGAIFYSALNANGSPAWQKKISTPGLTNLVGFGGILWSELGLVTNSLRSGKQVVDVLEMGMASGLRLASHFIGDGIVENKFFKTTNFNARQITVGVAKNSAGQFKIVRNIMYGSANIETEHTYTIPGTVDFGISGAMDNAGDVMGICLPQDGKLVFIKHFCAYQTSPDNFREYTVPTGSSIVTVKRSIDGGYIFGLNRSDSSEMVFIKTDSIGILSGCGYTTINAAYTETLNKQNTTYGTPETTVTVSATTGTLSFANGSNTTLFNCNEMYCPPPPTEDTCLSTYYKLYRSNSYVDAMWSYMLMRNNRHLVSTGRLDRYMNGMGVVTQGLKLLDESGKFIKGVEIHIDEETAFLGPRQINDSTAMLITRSAKEGIVYFTFTLITDDLQILWSKTIKTNNDFSYNAGGNGLADLHCDAEGNYYFVSTSFGFGPIPPKVLVYKMDNAGNQVWLKAYNIESGLISKARAVSTYSSLVVIVEGGNHCVTFRLDKLTGQMLNLFKYQNSSAGSEYDRFAKFENGRIYYTGLNGNNGSMVGVFDTLGRPIRLRNFGIPAGIIWGSAVKSGYLYGTFKYFTGTAYKDVLFKMDSNLNLVFCNSYTPISGGYACGLAVNESGSIYIAGNFSYGGVNGSYYDPFISKYNADGIVGTCNYTPFIPPMVDLPINTTPLSFSPIPVAVTPDFIPIQFSPDTLGQRISAVLCSSTQECDFIDLTGPSLVCNPGQDYQFDIDKNTSCTLNPVWIYDTTYVAIQSTTDTAAIIHFKKTGSTWIKVKLNAGCTVYMDSVQVEIQNTPSSLDLGNDRSFCPGDTVILNAGGGFHSYTWQDGSTDTLFIATNPGQYYVTVDNLCGDIHTDTVNLTYSVIPYLNIGIDTSICRTDTLFINASPGFSSYSWLPSTLFNQQAQQVKIVPLQNEIITLTATTAGGCHAYDTLAITVKEARPVFLGKDTSFCASGSLLLSAGSNYAQYTWSNGSHASSITVSGPAGQYWVNVTDTNGCKTTDTLVIQQVYSLPVINLGTDFDLCNGEQKRLDAGNFTIYNWQDGSNGKYLTVTQPGLYWVNVTDNNGCSTRDTVILKNILPVPADFLAPTDSICQYDKLQVIPSKNFSDYLWSTGSVQPSITVETPGTYMLTVKDVNGCEGSDAIRIVQKICYTGIYFPNAFTPNGDRLNDEFKARVYGSVISYLLRVYNRNGELVFMTNDPMKGWNGIFGGLPQSSAVFVWQCSYQFRGGDPSFEKGIVTLIR